MSKQGGEITITESNNERHQPNVIDTCNSAIGEISIKKMNTYPFCLRDIVMTIVTILMYFFDVGSDINLAYQYYSLKRWHAFGFTAAFVVIPLIVINLKSLQYYKLDRYAERKIQGPKTTGRFWGLRVILTFPFMMGIVVRHIQFLYHGWKSRSGKSETLMLRQYRLMLLERTRAVRLGMFEAFLESAPQLILQMYLMLTESTNLTDDKTSIFRIASMFISWIGTSWSLAGYYKALNADDDSYELKEIRLSTCATVFYFLWRLFEVGPRMVLLALFASQFQWYTSIVVGVHWILAILWVILRKDTVCDKHQILSYLLIGLVLIFCFQNIRGGGRSRYKALLYYCVVYTENLVMLVLWLCFTSHKDDGYYIAAIVVVLMGMILHIIFQLLYYTRCHHNKDKIESWSCLNCYQSVFDSFSPWGCTSYCPAQPEPSGQESSQTEQYPLHVLHVPNLEEMQTEK